MTQSCSSYTLSYGHLLLTEKGWGGCFYQGCMQNGFLGRGTDHWSRGVNDWGWSQDEGSIREHTHQWLRRNGLHSTYKSRGVVVSRSFGVTIGLQNRVGLDNLILQCTLLANYHTDCNKQRLHEVKLRLTLITCTTCRWQITLCGCVQVFG